MLARPAPRLLILLAYLGFVSLGLPDAVLGIAWPSLRVAFALPQAALGWPLGAAAVGYFASGMLAGRILARSGAGRLLAGSTIAAALGVAGYALAPAAAAFVAAAFVVGWGSGAVDSGLNAYAAEHFAPRHMAWLHAAYSAGAALGAMIMTSFVQGRAGFRHGYAVLAAALAILAVAFMATARRWDAPRKPDHADVKASLTTLEALGIGSVRLQALIFFVYSGVEFGVGHWSYTILTQARAVEPERAGLMVTTYWASLFIGRLLCGFAVERFGSVRLVRWGTFAAGVGAVAIALPTLPTLLTAFALALVGFAIAPIYPSLMSETPRRVGTLAAPHAVGFQVSAAMIGAVTLPMLGGVLASRSGPNATAALVAVTALTLLALNGLLARKTAHLSRREALP